MRGLRTAMKSGPRLPQLEKALAQKRRTNTAKNKINKFIKKQNKTTTTKTVSLKKKVHVRTVYTREMFVACC